MDNDIETTFWNKKSNDVTVGDTIKIVAAVSAISIAVPAVFLGVVAGVAKIGEKIQIRRSKKALESAKLEDEKD